MQFGWKRHVYEWKQHCQEDCSSGKTLLLTVRRLARRTADCLVHRQVVVYGILHVTINPFTADPITALHIAIMV